MLRCKHACTSTHAQASMRDGAQAHSVHDGTHPHRARVCAVVYQAVTRPQAVPHRPARDGPGPGLVPGIGPGRWGTAHAPSGCTGIRLSCARRVNTSYEVVVVSHGCTLRVYHMDVSYGCTLWTYLLSVSDARIYTAGYARARVIQHRALVHSNVQFRVGGREGGREGGKGREESERREHRMLVHWCMFSCARACEKI
jgi:hypothetical protein